MRVKISAQQRCLKKQKARVPHCRRSAEPRKDHFADHRLDGKEQECAEKNRDGVGENHFEQAIIAQARAEVWRTQKGAGIPIWDAGIVGRAYDTLNLKLCDFRQQ